MPARVFAGHRAPRHLVSAALSTARWESLCARLNIVNAAGIFRQLERYYSGRSRRYHNGSHINHCLAQLEASSRPEARDPLLEFAIWFHDVIYSTMSARNELRSADLAAAVLKSAGASVDAQEEVRSLIRATSHREPPRGIGHQLITDIDLTPLGASPGEFRDTEERIRAEYGWVPRKLYRIKRLDLLRDLCQRPQIFSLDEFYDRYETQARANISWLLDQPHGETSTFRWRRPPPQNT